MPVYNAGPYLSEAIQSVLDQTYDNLELVLVDDGSTDDSPEIATRFAKEDHRLRVVRQPNRGLVGALETGLAHVRGDLVARMDGDDRCPPHRLARQEALLHQNRGWVAVGSWAARIDERGRRLSPDWRTPVSPGAIRWMLCFESCLPHGAVTMRRAAVDRAGGYRGEYGEDYDLWIRLLEEGELAQRPRAAPRAAYPRAAVRRPVRPRPGGQDRAAVARADRPRRRP